MKGLQSGSARKMHALVGHEVRYERSFVQDLKRLEANTLVNVQQFVFHDFYDFLQIQDLPEFRQLDASGMTYRFTLDGYLVGFEIVGRIVKFLRVVPKPKI